MYFCTIYFQDYNACTDISMLYMYILYIYNKLVASSNPVHGESYSIKHNVEKFVSDLRQVGGFLRVLPFPPPIILTATMWLKYCYKEH